jgi:hypothetical protein
MQLPLAAPEDKARRQNAMDIMMSSILPLDLSATDLLEVTLNLYSHSIVRFGVDDETGKQALNACLLELRARDAEETNTTLN